MHQEDSVIISNESMGGNYYRMVLSAPLTAAAAVPGQFVHVSCSDGADPLLRRPFSIYDADPDAGTVSLLYARVGRGTELLSRMIPGHRLNILGALGTGFTLSPPEESTVLVGGGVGIAPLLFLGKTLKNQGRSVTVLLGMQTDETRAIISDFEQAGLEVSVATNDGSLGACGHVTCLMDPDQARQNPSCRVYACGPAPMLRAVQSWVVECGLEAELSLEERMGCGVGVCLSCVCKVKVKQGEDWDYKRVCVEGPVFPAREVILDD